MRVFAGGGSRYLEAWLGVRYRNKTSGHYPDQPRIRYPASWISLALLFCRGSVHSFFRFGKQWVLRGAFALRRGLRRRVRQGDTRLAGKRSLGSGRFASSGHPPVSLSRGEKLSLRSKKARKNLFRKGSAGSCDSKAFAGGRSRSFPFHRDNLCWNGCFLWREAHGKVVG